jgi:RNA recognition motif-containing protein
VKKDENAEAEDSSRQWGYIVDAWHKCILLKTKASGKHKVEWEDGTISILDADCIQPRVKKAKPAEAKVSKKDAKRAVAEAVAETDVGETKKPKKLEKQQAPEVALAETTSSEAEAKPANGGSATADYNVEDLTVFVRGLPFKVSEDIVKKDFAECGEILSINMPMNDDGRPRGIAFIKYASKAGVEGALAFDGTDYGGRYLEVMQAWDGVYSEGKSKGEKGTGRGTGRGKGKGKSSQEKGANSDFAVFVGGLPFAVDEAGVREHFSDCGTIASVRMPTSEDGKPKGIAFLRFTCDEHVDAAVQLNESNLGGRNVLVRRATDTVRNSDGKTDKDKGKAGKGKKSKTGK